MVKRELGEPMYLVKREERFLNDGQQLTREAAREYFGEEQFNQCMQHARDNNMLVAFVAVRGEGDTIVNAYISKVPNDGKKRPLEYEAP